MKKSRLISALVLLGVLTTLVAACGNDSASEPIIEDAWARPGEQGDNSAAYMQIENDGGTDIVLIGASGDIAGAVEIHESRMDEGTMRMEEAPEIVVPAGESVSLEPGGFHVMLMNLEQELSPGDSFELTLHFDDLDDIELDVTVEEQ